LILGGVLLVELTGRPVGQGFETSDAGQTSDD